jgi:uncharacterized protein (TIGR00369 family)
MDDATLRALAEHNPSCLGCGADNVAGVGLRIVEHGDGALRATVSFSRIHEGAQGRTHGGAIATALDEAFGQLAQIEFEGGCATGELAVRYHRPTPADGSIYVVRARVTGREGRKIHMDAELLAGDEVQASANAVMFAVPVV